MRFVFDLFLLPSAPANIVGCKRLVIYIYNIYRTFEMGDDWATSSFLEPRLLESFGY